MQETKRRVAGASSKNRKRTSQRDGTQQNIRRHRGEPQQITPRVASAGFGFLNTRFDDLIFDNVDIPKWEVSRIEDCLDKFSYSNLYRSAERYCKLLGRELKLPYRPDGDLRNEYLLLYNALASMLPENQNLDFYQDHTGISFYIWYTHHMDWMKVYVIPVKFIKSMKGIFKLLCTRFVNQFLYSQGIPFITDNYHIDMMYEYGIEDQWDTGWDLSLMRSYKDGKISKFIKNFQGYSGCTAEDLDYLFSQYSPLPEEKRIYDCILKGISLLKENKSISDYDYNYHFDGKESHSCDGCITIDASIIGIYEDDFILRSLFEGLDNEMNSGAETLAPCSYLFITPSTDHLLKVDDYPERLIDWLEEFATTV